MANILNEAVNTCFKKAVDIISHGTVTWTSRHYYSEPFKVLSQESWGNEVLLAPRGQVAPQCRVIRYIDSADLSPTDIVAFNRFGWGEDSAVRCTKSFILEDRIVLEDWIILEDWMLGIEGEPILESNHSIDHSPLELEGVSEAVISLQRKSPFTTRLLPLSIFRFASIKTRCIWLGQVEPPTYYYPHEDPHQDYKQCEMSLAMGNGNVQLRSVLAYLDWSKLHNWPVIFPLPSSITPSRDRMSRVTDCTNVSASSHCDEDSKTEVEPLRLELDEHADYYPDSLKIQGVVRTPRQHVGGIPYSASHIIGSLTTRAIHPKAMQRAHHSKQSWEDNRPVIEQLWRRDGLALKQVKEVMDKRGFVASEREYYPRLKQWGLTKNIRGEDMSILYRKMVQRKAVEDKDTNFTLHGQAVDLKRIHRFVKRVALSPSGLPEQATPVYVFAFTPRSPHKNNCVTFPWSQSPHKHFLQIMKGKLAETAQRESLYDLSWLDEQTGNLNEFDLGFGDETLTSCSTVDFDSHPIIYYTKERKDSIFPAFGLQLIKGDFDTI